MILVGTAELHVYNLCVARCSSYRGLARSGHLGVRIMNDNGAQKFVRKSFCMGGSGRLEKARQVNGPSMQWPGRKPFGIPRFADTMVDRDWNLEHIGGVLNLGTPGWNFFLWLLVKQFHSPPHPTPPPSLLFLYIPWMLSAITMCG